MHKWTVTTLNRWVQSKEEGSSNYVESIVEDILIEDTDSDKYIAAVYSSVSDAQLIAAAPDLLEAAEEVLELVDNSRGRDLDLECFETLRAAVARARR